MTFAKKTLRAIPDVIPEDRVPHRHLTKRRRPGATHWASFFSIMLISRLRLAGEVVSTNGLATIFSGTLGGLLNVLMNHAVESIEGISTHIDIMLLECSLGLASDEKHFLVSHGFPFLPSTGSFTQIEDQLDTIQIEEIGSGVLR